MPAGATFWRPDPLAIKDPQFDTAVASFAVKRSDPIVGRKCILDFGSQTVLLTTEQVDAACDKGTTLAYQAPGT